MYAQLTNGAVVVPDAREANRLLSRGRFGTPLSGGASRLSLVEAAYLAETERLTVASDGNQLALPDLVALAAAKSPGFEIDYLVYRELRGRGYLLQPSSPADRRRGIHFTAPARTGAKTVRARHDVLVAAISERETASVKELIELARVAARRSATLLLAIVDEESDLTYYALSTTEPHGTAPDAKALPEPADAAYLRDRAFVWDETAAKALNDSGFFGKRVGPGLQLSLVECLYLVRKGLVRVVERPGAKPLAWSDLKRMVSEVDRDVAQRLAVYTHLRARGLTVKTGFKFGTHFRAYDKDPRKDHAPFLVHVVGRDHATGWPQLSRAVRLAHGVRKTFLLAVTGGRGVTYVSLVRHRP